MILMLELHGGLRAHRRDRVNARGGKSALLLRLQNMQDPAQSVDHLLPLHRILAKLKEELEFF